MLSAPRSFTRPATILAIAAMAAAPATRFAAEDVVVMPKFEVKDFPDLPARESWRYAQTPTLEILADASDSTTQKVVRQLRDFEILVDIACPTFLDLAPSYPVTVVICGKGARFRALAMGSLDAVVLVHDGERLAAVVVDSGMGGIDYGACDELFRSLILSRLSGLHPRYPAWFEEGMAQLLGHMQQEGRQIVFNRSRDPVAAHASFPAAGNSTDDLTSLQSQISTGLAQSAGAGAQVRAGRSGPAAVNAIDGKQANMEDQDFFTYFNGAGMLPLEELLAVGHGDAETSNSSGIWAKECWAFTDFCLYSEHQRYRTATVQFIRKMARQPDADVGQVFLRCFGKPCGTIAANFRGYLGGRSVEHVRLPKAPESSRPLALRDATDAEIGRIKGDILLASGRADEAHLQYLAPYIRGGSDPRLLASLGLFEASAPRFEARRTEALLGAAIKGGVDRPQAYACLARLRLKEAESAPAGRDGRLSPEQVLAVLSLLSAARSRPPPLPEDYGLVAEAWGRSAARPTAAQLGVLVEGAHLFPDDPDLIDRAAATCEDCGFPQAAAQIASLGMSWITDAGARARLARFVKPAR